MVNKIYGVGLHPATRIVTSSIHCDVSVADLGLEKGGSCRQILKTMPTSVAKLRLFCASEHLNCNVYIKVQCVGHILARGECVTISSYECAK